MAEPAPETTKRRPACVACGSTDEIKDDYCMKCWRDGWARLTIMGLERNEERRDASRT